jgi:glutathione S-transferase
MSKPGITAYDWVPWFARGQVRDLRVRWALEEAGQGYDVRYLPQGTQKAPPHRALQPFGQVPTFEQGGVELFESGAIVLHVAQTRPGLLPKDAAARARAMEWMFAALNTVEPVVWDRIVTRYIDGDKPWAKERMVSVEARLRERLDELSTRLGDSEWLDGAFSAGDLLMVQVLRHAGDSEALKAFPNLVAYIDRGMARPAFARALSDLRAGLTGEPPANWPH